MAHNTAEGHVVEASMSRALLKELVELRQVRLEKESLQQANSHYITLVSHLELTISELKVQLQAKESEIVKWKTRAKKLSKKLEKAVEGDTQIAPERTAAELSNKLILLEEENAQLKSYASLSSELEKLRLQLEQSNQLQSIYKEKYQEAKVKLVTLTVDKSENSDSKLEKISEKRDYTSRKQEEGYVSPSPSQGEMRHSLMSLGSSKLAGSVNSSAMAFLLPEPNTPKLSSFTPSVRSSPKTSFSVKSPPKKASALISHKSNTLKKGKKTADLKIPVLSAYIPSFTRQKRPDKSSDHGPIDPMSEHRRVGLATVDDESEFADYFPDERELG